MELVIAMLTAVLLDIAALRWGADSTRSETDNRLRDGRDYRAL